DRSDCSDRGHRAPRLRRRRDRSRRSGAPGRDRGPPAGQAHGDHLQVAVRQGAHRDGRGRLRGGDGQRQQQRQLAGPLPRHHARGEVPQQLADGRAARAGGPRPGLGAGDLRRAVRPHEGREDQPAQLRRAHLPAAGARRRPHRPGADPHPAAEDRVAAAGGPRRDRRLRGQHPGLPRVHDHRAVHHRRSDRRGRRLLPRLGEVRPLRRARRRAGHRRGRQELPGDVQLLGVHRRRARARPARRRHADQHGVPAVPPDRHGLAAVGEGDPRHRVGARRRRHPQELRGQAVHVRLRAGRVQGPVRDHARGGRPLVHRRRQQPAPPGAAAPRRGGPRDQLRGQGGPGEPPRRRVPRHRLPAHAGGDPEAAAVDVPPVQGAGRRRHHQGADGGRPHLPLRHGRGGGRPRLRDVEGARPVRRGRGGGRHARVQPAGRQLAVRPARVRPAGRRGRRGVRRRARGRAPGRRGGRRRRRRGPRAAAVLQLHRRRGEPLRRAAGAAEDDERPGRHHPQGRRDGAGAQGAAGHRGPHPHGQRAGRPGVQPRLAPRAGPAQHAAGVAVRGAGRAGAPGEPRRAHPRRLPGDGLRLAPRAAGAAGPGRGRRRAGAPGAGADAARPVRPVRVRRAEEVLHRRGARWPQSRYGRGRDRRRDGGAGM
ncbi:MAG: Succinate dehydrogenase flavoprotein subunit, partial [uncultured Pseudonocardia sp.]